MPFSWALASLEQPLVFSLHLQRNQKRCLQPLAKIIPQRLSSLRYFCRSQSNHSRLSPILSFIGQLEYGQLIYWISLASQASVYVNSERCSDIFFMNKLGL